MNTLIREKRFVLILLGLLLLAACKQSSLPTSSVTPPIAPAKTPTAVSTPIPSVAPAAAASEATAVTPPLQPTAPPTAVPPSPPPAQPVAQIRLLPVADGFEKPVYLTHAFDGRLFVAEQKGVIYILENGEVLERPFLDIRDRVGSQENEQGLLSVAFHPNYGENGRFYLNYTNLDGDTVIAGYVVGDDPNQADPASETILMTLYQPYGNHNGGQVLFGPDGYLYIGMGDGGSADDPDENGQNRATLLGTLLRIDVDNAGNGAAYAIPPDNPFVNDDDKRNEIWAYGLRNPWRFSFDRLTNDLFIADVGQNEWEEVHFQPADSASGLNYGWDIMEGTHCFKKNRCDQSGLEQPIFEYNHDDGCSITGGYIYRGTAYPALQGNYFTADFCSGVIWSLLHTPDGAWLYNRVYESDIQISSFGEDADGELYLLDHTSGSIWQLGTAD